MLEAADKLIQFPELGRKNAALGNEHVRKLLVEKYRLVYYTDKQLVTILSIRHQARNR
ncbi:MAG: type II toxin-antitoxin system RelE/ParE family toxin [Hymenobacter sp.]|nr:MAG: type II toxin-antitoxin system RelE/ParE family toxin [Hymenobacter sp.]